MPSSQSHFVDRLKQRGGRRIAVDLKPEDNARLSAITTRLAELTGGSVSSAKAIALAIQNLHKEMGL